MSAYLDGLEQVGQPGWRSVIVTGPELPARQAEEVRRRAKAAPMTRVLDFTNDMVGVMGAADCVVSMGGYNSVCELLMLGKPAIVVPRSKPVVEQRMRAERMERLGLFRAMMPEDLGPETLMAAVEAELERKTAGPGRRLLDLGALPRISAMLRGAEAMGEGMAEEPAEAEQVLA